MRNNLFGNDFKDKNENSPPAPHIVVETIYLMFAFSLYFLGSPCKGNFLPASHDIADFPEIKIRN